MSCKTKSTPKGTGGLFCNSKGRTPWPYMSSSHRFGIYFLFMYFLLFSFPGTKQYQTRSYSLLTSPLKTTGRTSHFTHRKLPSFEVEFQYILECSKWFWRWHSDCQHFEKRHPSWKLPRTEDTSESWELRSLFWWRVFRLSSRGNAHVLFTRPVDFCLGFCTSSPSAWRVSPHGYGAPSSLPSKCCSNPSEVSSTASFKLETPYTRLTPCPQSSTHGLQNTLLLTHCG